MTDTETCKNCGDPIKRVNWALGPGWAHQNDRVGESRCRLRATPETPEDPPSAVDPEAPETWQYSAALKNPDGTLALVGCIESDDETSPRMYPADERAMEHYRAWDRYPDHKGNVVLVRRRIDAWEEVQCPTP